MAYKVEGSIISFRGQFVLAFGPDAGALGAPAFGPPVFLRPGYRLWEPPSPYFLPHTVVDDIGQEFEAPDVYAWIEERGDLFPRSDVVGVLETGEPRGIVTKHMDLTDLAAFASPVDGDAGPFVRVALAVEARAVPDKYALAPCAPPVPLLARALPSYRLSPGVFGAVGAAILGQLLNRRRRDWRLTYDEIDEMLGEG